MIVTWQSRTFELGGNLADAESPWQFLQENGHPMTAEQFEALLPDGQVWLTDAVTLYADRARAGSEFTAAEFADGATAALETKMQKPGDPDDKAPSVDDDVSAKAGPTMTTLSPEDARKFKDAAKRESGSIEATLPSDLEAPE